MAERPVLDLATKSQVLAVLEKNARKVLEGKRNEVCLVYQDFERTLSKPQRIFVAEGPRRVSWALREVALCALQGELGMGGVVSQEFESSRRRVTFEIAVPHIFIVQITSWTGDHEPANSVSWYLVRADTSVFSRWRQRLMGQRLFVKARKPCPSYS